MLMEEERFIAEANNAAKLSAEIIQFQRESRQQKAVERSQMHGFSRLETSGSHHDASMIIDQQKSKRTEPLITKAYNAFRKNGKSKN